MNTVSHNLNNLPIGFFDSGVGGLSVYSRFRKELPCENTLYFGDLLHLPYGNKSKEELIGYARTILDFYKVKKVKAVVIACNTSSAQAYETIKDEYEFKIYPIIQSCAKVISEFDVKKIGVYATQATVNSGVYFNEIKKYNSNINVREIACPHWVEIVEGAIPQGISPEDDIAEKVKEMMKFAPEKIILGCTHYPYLLSDLEKYISRDIFIDPAEIFVKYIKEDLEKNGMLNQNLEDGFEEIFVSASPESFVKNSKIFYEIKSFPKLV